MNKAGAIKESLETCRIQDSTADRQAIESAIDSIIARWENGDSPDAHQALQDDPKLQRNRSVLLELACEEFWLRTGRGEAVSAHDFCDRFPGYSTALRRLLVVQSAIGDDGQRFHSWPEVGSEYRGFRLNRCLGVGAFSRVYLSADTKLGDRLAVVKLTRLSGNEPTVLGKLEHDNIVPVLAFYAGEGDEPGMLVMPFVGSATLEDLLDRVRAEADFPQTVEVIRRLLQSSDSRPSLQLREFGANLQEGSFLEAIVGLARGLCLGLHEAHVTGFLHLDIKPSNILLARNGTPKLLDFNLTQGLGDIRSAMGGTLPYMSPEQLDAVFQPQLAGFRLDARSDLFSLGVVLYELVTRKHPFGPVDVMRPTLESATELRDRHRLGPPPIRALNPLIPHSLATLIESALASEPHCRPSSADELANLLETELARLEHAKKARRKTSWLVGLIVMTLGVTLLFGAMGLSQITTRQTTDVVFEEGLHSFEQGHFDEAVKHLSAYLDHYPQDVDALLLRARSLVRLNRATDALEDYQRADGLRPSHDGAAGILYCLAQLGNFTRAVSQGQNLASRSDCDAIDLNNFAYALLKLNRHAEARPYLDRAVALDPTSAVIRFNRALTDRDRHLRDPQYVPLIGLDDLRMAIALDPIPGEPYQYAGYLELAVSPNDPVADLAAIQWFIEAAKRGANVHSFTSDMKLRRLQNYSEFHGLLNVEVERPHQYSARRLMQP